MSFATELDALVGDATSTWDIRAAVRRCFHYDFVGSPVYLWAGQGVLTTEDGQDWLGTVDAAGVDHHRVPPLRDPRDGTSPAYEFALPYLDRATYLALKADKALAEGRTLTIWRALVHATEGLLPATPLQFAMRLTMVAVEFREGIEEPEPGRLVATYSASALCRSAESGRSRAPMRTINPTVMQARAARLSLTDSGADFVAANSRRTYIVQGG